MVEDHFKRALDQIERIVRNYVNDDDAKASNLLIEIIPIITQLVATEIQNNSAEIIRQIKKFEL